jgi:PhoPQ-activated pathogenicity-related protein
VQHALSTLQPRKTKSQTQTATLAEPQLLLTQLATGRALMDGLAAAHLSMHALSLHGQANAQACEAAQLATAKQASISDAHLSKLQLHWDSHTAVVQSMSLALYSFLDMDICLPVV